MKKPLYLKIKKEIEVEIEDLKSNEVIESERVLSKRLEASRMTIRKALDELVEEGFLYRKKNVGTFVSDKSLRKKNTVLSNEKSENLEYRLLNFDVKYTAEDEILKNLNLNYNDSFSLIRTVRLVLRNDRPLKIEEFYVIRNLVDEKDINKFDKPLGVNSYQKDSTMNQKFIPMIVPVRYAATLGLKMDEPIIMIEGTIIDESGKPYIYYKTYNHPTESEIEITV